MALACSAMAAVGMLCLASGCGGAGAMALGSPPPDAAAGSGSDSSTSAPGVAAGGSSGDIFGDMPGGGSPSACGEDLQSVVFSSACLQCMAKRCAEQFTQCAVDCTCDETVFEGLECLNGGASVNSCFASTFAVGVSSTNTSLAAMCLALADRGCGCGTPDGGLLDASSTPDASCVDFGWTGSGGGDGTCSESASENCGGASYQVVCSCPRGECACLGDVTTVIPYAGCPYCPAGLTTMPGQPLPEGGLSNTDLYAACGFPK